MILWRTSGIVFSVNLVNLKIKNNKKFHLEPIASTKPKVDQNNKFNGEVANVGETFRLNCIGQAYPKPIYKWVYLKLFSKNFRQ